MDAKDRRAKSSTEAPAGEANLPTLNFGILPKSRTKVSLLVLSFIGIMLLVLASPFVLILVNKTVKVNWTVLSNIGQAYGLVSALVSAIALSGVAFSLILQRRQYEITQLQTLRAMQFELVQMGYQNPNLSEVFGADERPDYMAEHRYINLWFMYYQAGYRIGAFSDSTMSRIATSSFRSERFRQWWLDDRETYAAHADTATGRRFVTLVDNAYREVVKPTDSSGDHRSTQNLKGKDAHNTMKISAIHKRSQGSAMYMRVRPPNFSARQLRSKSMSKARKTE